MKLQRRKNLLYGLLAVLVAGAVLARALDVFPAYIDDVIGRSAPVILVILGLSVLLRNRIPLSGLISVIIGAILVGGVSITAFSIRASQNRDDNQVTITESVSDSVILLRLRMQTLDTDVEIVRTANNANGESAVNVRFVGSNESEIIQNYIEDPDGTANFNLDELRKNPLPILESVGRGTLLVEVPPDVPIDLQIQLADGDLRMSMTNVDLERLNITVEEGDAIITLPEYEPQYSRSEETLGTWSVLNGSLLVRVPSAVSARFDMSNSTGGDPTYDASIYNLLFGRDILEARNIDAAEIEMRYDLVVSRDQLTVDVPESETSVTE